MNDTLEELARDKRSLLRRSAESRLQLRRDIRGVRESMPWKRAAVAAAGVPALRRVALGAAISLIGAGRSARILIYAGRVLLLAKLAHALFIGARNAVAGRTGS